MTRLRHYDGRYPKRYPNRFSVMPRVWMRSKDPKEWNCWHLPAMKRKLDPLVDWKLNGRAVASCGRYFDKGIIILDGLPPLRSRCQGCCRKRGLVRPSSLKRLNQKPEKQP